MSERSGMVQTVRGLVEPAALGHTQPHEHLLVNLLPPALKAVPGEPITLETLGALRKSAIANPENLRLTSEEDAIQEMRRYKALGGGAVLDATSIGISRDPAGLARISEATGVHVIMGSGYYELIYHPAELETLSEDALADRMVREVVDGVEDTGIRPGVIGEIGLGWPLAEQEAKVLRAAARAQRETGAPLMIHPGRHADAPLEAMRIVREAGGDSERTIICHIERTLFAIEEMIELAGTGCYLEFDLFGQEASHYPFAAIDLPNDAVRIDYMTQLLDHGYGDRLLMAQDICMKVHLTRYGGEGYYHILETVLPMMERKGMTQADIRRITVDNPARILAFR